jgi:hypothetical protein
MLAPRERFARLVFLALFLQGFAAFPAGGLVLCVASDGHVAVENGGCDRASAPNAGSCQEIGHAAPCSDTPLDAPELVSAKGKRADDPGAALALAASPLGSFALATRTDPRAGAAALSAPGRRQRSAVLRL